MGWRPTLLRVTGPKSVRPGTDDALVLDCLRTAADLDTVARRITRLDVSTLELPGHGVCR